MLNPGEYARLEIELRNTGSKNSSHLEGSLTTESTYVKELSEKIEYSWSVQAGTTARQTTDNGLRLSPDTPPLTVIPFLLSLVDEQEQVHLVEFSVTVLESAGRLQIASIGLEQDSNGDGVANPGEHVRIEIEVENSGSSRISSLRGDRRNASVPKRTRRKERDLLLLRFHSRL